MDTLHNTDTYEYLHYYLPNTRTWHNIEKRMQGRHFLSQKGFEPCLYSISPITYHLSPITYHESTSITSFHLRCRGSKPSFSVLPPGSLDGLERRQRRDPHRCTNSCWYPTRTSLALTLTSQRLSVPRTLTDPRPIAPTTFLEMGYHSTNGPRTIQAYTRLACLGGRSFIDRIRVIGNDSMSIGYISASIRLGPQPGPFKEWRCC